MDGGDHVVSVGLLGDLSYHLGAIQEVMLGLKYSCHSTARKRDPLQPTAHHYTRRNIMSFGRCFAAFFWAPCRQLFLALLSPHHSAANLEHLDSPWLVVSF